MSNDRRPPFQTNPVDSSALARLAYDQPRAVLHVLFRDGGMYQYFGVPQQAYTDLLQAESKGAYFNGHIRNQFPHAKS